MIVYHVGMRFIRNIGTTWNWNEQKINVIMAEFWFDPPFTVDKDILNIYKEN